MPGPKAGKLSAEAGLRADRNAKESAPGLSRRHDSLERRANAGVLRSVAAPHSDIGGGHETRV